MSTFAANPAGLPYLSPCVVERANKILRTCDDGVGSRPSCGGYACSNRAALAVNFRSQCADDNFALERVCRYVSRLLLGHSFGAFPAPGDTRSSASHCAPLWGLGSSQNKFANHGKERLSTSFGPLPESRPSALGSRAHSLSPAQCDPSNNGRIQTNGDTIMYQNKVTLIGFLGSNPEVRTNNNRSFTTLSLATKSSYKKDDKYISHTECHRCVVYGKLSEFAKTLTKGAHVQVEGELRSREDERQKTDSKQRVSEIRVASILKLDRAEKAAPEDQ